jgi:hypothetical protein
VLAERAGAGRRLLRRLTHGARLLAPPSQEAHKLEKLTPPMAVTNAVSWRQEGIKHRKNEIFLDVVERLNLLVAANGTLLRSEILGSLKMRSYLSGMPELKLGLNDKLLFEATGRRTGGRGCAQTTGPAHSCGVAWAGGSRRGRRAARPAPVVILRRAAPATLAPLLTIPSPSLTCGGSLCAAGTQGEGEGGRDGGHQVPPVRPSRALRE